MKMRIALVAALLWGGAVFADDLDKWTFEVTRAMKYGEPEAVLPLLNDKVKEAMIAAPAKSYAVMRMASRYVPGMRRTDAAKAEEVAKWFFETAQAIKEHAPDDPLGIKTLAAAHAINARLAAGKEPPDVSPDWNSAADLIAESYAKGSKDGGEGYADGAGWMREAAVLPGADAAALVARAEGFSQKSTEGFPGTIHSDIAKAQACFAKAQTSLKSAPNDVKPALETCVLTLQPHVMKDPPDLRVGTIYTEAVTFAKTNKIPVKGDYRMVSVPTGTLQFAMPASEGWRQAGGGGDTSGIAQFDSHGSLLRRMLVRTYDWKVHYVDDEARANIDGGNVKGLAKIDMQLRKRDDFNEVTASKDLIKAPLNSKIATSQAYELAGKDKHGDFLRARVYFFKGKEQMLTYQIAVLEYVDIPKLDPEVDAVIDNVTEQPKKK